MEKKSGYGVCPGCGGPTAEDDRWCPSCGASIKIGSTSIRVEGRDANEVSAVAGDLAAQATARREAARLRSPWFSGAFYLAALTVVVALLLVAGRVLSVWALPVMIAGSVLLVAVVGALQMRQDDRLSERGFLRLMGDVLRRLPRILARGKDGPRPKDENTSESGV